MEPSGLAPGLDAVLQEELREACTEGDLAAVRALIHAGADVTAKHPSTGVEPLSYAAFHGRWEVAKLLMLHGASPEHAVEEAQRGGFLPLAEYLRIRRARYQREAQAAAIEAKRQKEGEVLARKARFQQQHNEREQLRRGELLAGQMQRAAEHRLLDEQRKAEKAARLAARYAQMHILACAVHVCVCASVCVAAHTSTSPRATRAHRTQPRPPYPPQARAAGGDPRSGGAARGEQRAAVERGERTRGGAARAAERARGGAAPRRRREPPPRLHQRRRRARAPRAEPERLGAGRRLERLRLLVAG